MIGVKKSATGEDDIWLFLNNREEVGFSEWQKAFVDSGLMAKQTFQNHKKAIENQGKVKKRISEKTNRPVYYVPIDRKIELEALAVKKKFVQEFEKISPKEQLEILAKVTKERDRYKRLNRIHELESLPALPLRAVLKKLLELDYKLEDFYSKEDLSDKDIKESIAHPFRENFTLPARLEHVYMLGDVAEELSNIDNIELKLIPPEDYCLIISDGSKNVCSDHPDVFKIKTEYGEGWLPLVDKPIKGAGIIGAWKELLTLYKEDFEDDLLHWKKQFALTKEDWETVGSSIREMMEQGCIPQEIHYFLNQFAESKRKKE